MSIVQVLEKKQDYRKEKPECDFNGFLEDYIYLKKKEIPNDLLVCFEGIQKKNAFTKICVNLKVPYVFKKANNKILKCKEVGVVKEELCIPYLIYVKEKEIQRAILLTQEDYFFSKGLFYSLTEREGAFEEERNEILVVPFQHEEEVLDLFDQLKTSQPGALQRKIDKKYFNNYIQLYSFARIKLENIGLNNAMEKEEKVLREFLMKKVVFVEYMVDKSLLEQEHKGNKEAQRTKARFYAQSLNLEES